MCSANNLELRFQRHLRGIVISSSAGGLQVDSTRLGVTILHMVDGLACAVPVLVVWSGCNRACSSSSCCTSRFGKQSIVLLGHWAARDRLRKRGGKTGRGRGGEVARWRVTWRGAAALLHPDWGERSRTCQSVAGTSASLRIAGENHAVRGACPASEAFQVSSSGEWPCQGPCTLIPHPEPLRQTTRA